MSAASMKHSLGCILGACACCLWVAPEAHATLAADMPPPTAQAVRRAAASASASSAAVAAPERDGLREGVIAAVDHEHAKVRIEGMWFRIVEGQTRLYRLGRAAEPGVLGKGQRVRFTLPTGAADGAVLGLVYVQ